jgi:restriction endonuclease Mrr
MANQSGRISFKEAAKQVLQSADEPLSAAEITLTALERGLIATEGKTPEATMAAILYTDIKDEKNTIFKKVGRGKFALKTQQQSASSPLLLIEQQNELVRKKLREKLHSMDPFQFEYFIADLLQAIGYEQVEVTSRSGDKGIDIVANLTVGGITNVKTVIQVKRYKENKNLSGKYITQLRGSAEVDQRGLIITTSGFTKDAREEAKAPNKMPVSLVDGERLIELLFKYEVGVKKEAVPIYSIHSEYFEEETASTEKQLETRKSKALWPLPGGADSYIETLAKILGKIQAGAFTRAELMDWLQSEYDTVNSTNTASGYLNVPKAMGLAHNAGGTYALTAAGEQYLASRSLEHLYEQVSNHILAFDDIYQFLLNAEEPQPVEQILEFLKENFDLNWTTLHQVNFRLSWLMGFGKVEKQDGGFVAIGGG